MGFKQSSRFKHLKVIILYYIRTRFWIILLQLGIVNIYTQQFRGQLKISLTNIIIGNLVSKLNIFIYFLDRYALSFILCVIDTSIIPLNSICVMFSKTILNLGQFLCGASFLSFPKIIFLNYWNINYTEKNKKGFMAYMK